MEGRVEMFIANTVSYTYKYFQISLSYINTVHKHNTCGVHMTCNNKNISTAKCLHGSNMFIRFRCTKYSLEIHCWMRFPIQFILCSSLF